MLSLTLVLLGCQKNIQTELDDCKDDLDQCNVDLTVCVTDKAACDDALKVAKHKLKIAKGQGGLKTTDPPETKDCTSCTDDQLMPGTIGFQDPADDTYIPGTVLVWHDPQLPLEWKEIWYKLEEESPAKSPTYDQYINDFKIASKGALLDWLNDCGGVACSELPASDYQEKAVMEFNYYLPPTQQIINSSPTGLPPGGSNYVFDVFNVDNGGNKSATPNGRLYREKIGSTYFDFWMLYNGDVDADSTSDRFFAGGATWSVQVEKSSDTHPGLQDFLQDMQDLRQGSTVKTGWKYVPIEYEWQ